MKEQIKNANDMRHPPANIKGLYPTRSANFTPNDNTEFVINPRKGNTKANLLNDTDSSYYFRYEAI